MYQLEGEAIKDNLQDPKMKHSKKEKRRRKKKEEGRKNTINYEAIWLGLAHKIARCPVKLNFR